MRGCWSWSVQSFNLRIRKKNHNPKRVSHVRLLITGTEPSSSLPTSPSLDTFRYNTDTKGCSCLTILRFSTTARIPRATGLAPPFYGAIMTPTNDPHGWRETRAV